MQAGDGSGDSCLRCGSDLLSTVVTAFRSRGFLVANYADVRGCVDIVAVRGDSRYAVRVLSNVDALREESVLEFLRVADALSAVPLVVGERTKRDRLRDDLLYRRYGAPVVTVRTLERILDGDIPSKEVYNGRILVYFDPAALRDARIRLGMSQHDLAKEVGTTKESIYRYEHGYPATEPIARKIVDILGDGVLSRAHLLTRGAPSSPARPGERSLIESPRTSPDSDHIYRFRRAPWDLFAVGVAAGARVSVALSEARGIVRRKVEILRRGDGIVHDYFAVIVSSSSHGARGKASSERSRLSSVLRDLPESVPLLDRSELDDVRGVKDLVRRILEEFE